MTPEAPPLTRSQLMAAMPPAARRAELLIVTAVAGVFFALCAAISAGFAWQEWRWQREAVPVGAEVLRLNRGTQRRPDSFMARYIDAQGREREAAVGFSDGAAPTPGERLTILVRPRVPYLGRLPGTGLDWIWIVPAAMAALIAALVAWQWRSYRLAAGRHRRLHEHGHRHPVHALRTVAVDWGKQRRRHGVIAHWRDPAGRERVAIAGPYSYDPAALLGPPQACTVLADPFDPSDALLASDGLPPPTALGLSREQRERLAPGH